MLKPLDLQSTHPQYYLSILICFVNILYYLIYNVSISSIGAGNKVDPIAFEVGLIIAGEVIKDLTGVEKQTL